MKRCLSQKKGQMDANPRSFNLGGLLLAVTIGILFLVFAWSMLHDFR